MLIELIHANGSYSAEHKTHTPPRGVDAPAYYSRLGAVLGRAAQGGATILYRPNLTSFTHNTVSNLRVVQETLASDPVMHELRSIPAVIVMPDGLLSQRQLQRNLCQEDQLLRECGRAIIVGAYTNVCVSNAAWNLQSRNPGYDIAIDGALSVDAGYQPIRPEFGGIPWASLEAEFQA